MFNSYTKPIHLAVSVAMAPYFYRVVASVQKNTKLIKLVSLGLVIFLVNVCFVVTAISRPLAASLFAGIPIFLAKV